MKIQTALEKEIKQQMVKHSERLQIVINFLKHFLIKNYHEILGGGRNVDDQNVDRPKISERRNGLFS